MVGARDLLRPPAHCDLYQVLGGAKLATLPVELSTRFELVINLKTPKLDPAIPGDAHLYAADAVMLRWHLNSWSRSKFRPPF